MAKKEFTIDEKINVVETYIRGEMGYGGIAARYGVPKSTLRHWIRRYKTFGVDGLLRKECNKIYSHEIKKHAVEEYLSGKGSLLDICIKYKIHSDTLLRNWIKAYNSHRRLRPSRGQGSDVFMTRGRNTTYEERVEIVSYCIEHDNDYAATIEKYGVSYQQIYSWVKKYSEKGTEGLVDKRGKHKLESEMTELEKLRAENRILTAKNKRLETENAVLKKLEEIEGGWR